MIHHPLSFADTFCARFGVAPLFTNTVPGAIWRYFWPIMAAAFFLRVGVAVSSDWIYRVDEIPEYLEQAHRLVFGYGIVPWDYHYGARNWLAVMPAATTLKLLQLMGLGHPDYYIPAVKILNATLSMAVPAGLYFFLRRHLSEIAARAGFVFCCFWWEFLIFAPHTLPEQYGGIFIAAGLGCMATRGGFFRLFLCGFLLGLAGMLRLQYAPAIGLLGLMYLLSLSSKRMPFLMLGGMAAVVLAGWSDYLFWGSWWHSYFQYIRIALVTDYFIGDGGENFSSSIAPFLQKQFFSSLGLYAILFFLGLWQWRKYWIPLLLIIMMPLIHNIHHHYSYLFLSFMMFAVLWGGVTEYLYSAKKPIFIIAGITAAFISTAGMFNWIPSMTKRFSVIQRSYDSPLFLYQSPILSIAKMIARLPSKQVKAVLWTGSDHVFTGSYYYLHHQVPAYYIYFSNFQERHRKIINDSGLPSSKLFSHIIAPSDQKFDGFVPMKFFEIGQGDNQIDVSIFENISGNDIWIPEKFSLHASWQRIDPYLKKHFKTPPPVFLPLREVLP